ncbi:MAG: sporulation peptidase YabG [Bacilli bacterium]|nr:sporulation peptidase YabG [Bacilli bacterium]MDD4808925.1 sporulation peptidase YabG [Bacilli bacterium]
MELKKGDLVTRESYNNDIVFVITDIIDDIYYLKGINIRLYADSELADLKKYVKDNDIEEELDFIQRVKPNPLCERDDYFYLPGKILHIDGDNDYLNRCLNYYKEANVMAIGKLSTEENIAYYISDWLDEFKPNIVVITGHDAYYKKKGETSNLNAYKNSYNFINAVKEARKYEKSHDKLIIVAGACQSDYEDLIRAGANFASSPRRVNIHALDPAIIATSMARADVNVEINVKKILENTKYGANGIGGITTKGTMYVGYPR